MRRSSTGSTSRFPPVTDPLLEEVRSFYEDHHQGIERARQARRYFYGYLERILKVRIPPGTQPGSRLRLAGQGIQGATGEPGDHYVRVKVKLPKTLTEEQ